MLQHLHDATRSSCGLLFCPSGLDGIHQTIFLHTSQQGIESQLGSFELVRPFAGLIAAREFVTGILCQLLVKRIEEHGLIEDLRIWTLGEKMNG